MARSRAGAPYVASALWTWTASSRVGTSTRPRGLRAAGADGARSRRRSIIGRPNAAVLPVPVWARASRSARSSTREWMAIWTGVGSCNPAARAAYTARARARVSKTALSNAPELPGALSDAPRPRQVNTCHARRRARCERSVHSERIFGSWLSGLEEERVRKGSIRLQTAERVGRSDALSYHVRPFRPFAGTARIIRRQPPTSVIPRPFSCDETAKGRPPAAFFKGFLR